jgi:anti-anti-sigma regulatory factor
MYVTEVDKPRNLLKIVCAEHVNAAEVKRCADELPPLLAELQPRFRLLADFSGLESMEVACAPQIARIMDLCNQREVEMVVRVISDPHKDIGLNIMSLFHYSRGVRIATCARLEEAMTALANDR